MVEQKEIYRCSILTLKGYTGQILWVDLLRKKLVPKELPAGLATNFIGGRGLAGKILFDNTGPQTDPLGPDNVLIVSAGPLNGTVFPMSGRYVVTAKSPLTGIWGDANSGGHFGNALKESGFDAVVFKNKSEDPVYLFLSDGKAELRDASDIWGLDVFSTTEILTKEVGDPAAQVSCIGQAGENMVRFAGVMTGRFRAAARAGMGAVYGSKRLKAIVAARGKTVEVHDVEKLFAVSEQIREEIKNDPLTKGFTTQLLVDPMNAIARFPTKNFQTGQFPNAKAIGGMTIKATRRVKDRACWACCIGSRRACYGELLPGVITLTDGPEYETLDSLGAMIWNSDLDMLIYLNNLVDMYGMDSISTGGTIAMAMELYEKGILKDEDIAPLTDLRWGNVEAAIDLVHMIARREGIGDILAEGTKRVAERIGEVAKPYAMIVKGMELASQDGRAQKSMGLAHAVASRGADHLRVASDLDGLPEAFVNLLKERVGAERLPEAADPLAFKHKGYMVKILEDFKAVVDSSVICAIGSTYPPAKTYWEELSIALTAATGFDFSIANLKVIGERIVNMERMYNARHGLSRKDDRLPERLLKEPAPDGPAKGHVVELDHMLDEYYSHRGWNKETGLPPDEKLRELGLDFVLKGEEG